MSTDTHDLIDKLSKDLAPVRVLAPANLRAILMSLSAFVLVLLVLHFVHEPRGDLAAALHQPVYLIQGLAMGVAGFLAAFAAFRLSVPDTRIRPKVKLELALASSLWGLLILAELLQTDAMPEPAPSCFIGLTIAISAPLALGIFMLMRSFPIWRGLAGYALVLSAGSFAALGMRFICPSDSPAHLLVWHFLPVIGFAIIGAGLGKILLKLNIAKK